MATSCLDKEYCENAWDCAITVLDTEGNPIDPRLIENYQNIVLVLGDKPGYDFRGFKFVNGAQQGWVRYQRRTDIDTNAYELFDVLCDTQYLVAYCPLTYTIRINVDGQGCMENSDIRGVQYGDIVQIRATEGYGCRFLNWTRNIEGNDVVVSEELSFPHVVTEDATFVAHYDTVLYRITAKPFRQNQGTCTGSGTYALGDTCVISADGNSYYTFRSWDDNVTDNPRTVVVNGNRTYVALFTYKENVVNVVPSSGGYAMGGGNYRAGQPVTLQAVPEPGWRFSHWLIDGETYNGEKYSFVPQGNETVLPVFTQEFYRITFTPIPIAGGNFTIANSQQLSYTYGQTVTVTATPTYGYGFISWDDGVTLPTRTFTMTTNINAKAIFTRNPQNHRITVVLPNDTYVCGVYYNGVNIGYMQTVERLAVGGTVVAREQEPPHDIIDFRTFTVPDDREIDVIEWHPTELVEVAVITTMVPEGALLKIEPVIPDGQKLVSVTDSHHNVIWNDTSTQSISYTVGDSDDELTLNFESLHYTMRLGIEPSNEDTLSAGAIFNVLINGNASYYTPSQAQPVAYYPELAYGTQIVLTAPMMIGENYQFSYWATDNGSFGQYTVSLTLDKNLTCRAIYREIGG